MLKWLLQAPRYLFIGLIRAYRSVVSPHLPNSCRFTPTCSRYALESYREFGVVRGTLLSVWRLLRCHPLGSSGYDPPSWFGSRPAHYEQPEIGPSDETAAVHSIDGE